MRPNIISQTLTEAQLQAILDAFTAAEVLMPWLIGLIDEQRKGGYKLGPENLPFLIRANELGHQDPLNFVPKQVDLAENDKDVVFAGQLGQILSKVRSIERKVQDTFVETGLEGLQDALSIKATIKQAAKDGIPGAQAGHDELSAMFKFGRKKLPGEAPKPPVPPIV